jgi:hypothetical protein
MTKLLEDALEQVRALPEEEQDLAAEMLFLIAKRHSPPYQMDAEEREVVERALAEADRGEFASDEAVQAVLNRQWR